MVESEAEGGRAPAERRAVREFLSRRALIAAGAGGGVAALLARAAGSPRGAEAATGSPLVLGTANTASSETVISTSRGSALVGRAVRAVGLRGSSVDYPGVRGESERGNGVLGIARASGKSGVRGESDAGIGVFGTSGQGRGVVAQSGSGIALDVRGPVRFSSAGLAVVPEGESSVSVEPGVELSDTSLVLATLNGPDPERTAGPAVVPITLWFVERDPDANTFELFLTDRVEHDVVVSWFVIG